MNICMQLLSLLADFDKVSNILRTLPMFKFHSLFVLRATLFKDVMELLPVVLLSSYILTDSNKFLYTKLLLCEYYQVRVSFIFIPFKGRIKKIWIISPSIILREVHV
jgi:hypothetical protein